MSQPLSSLPAHSNPTIYWMLTHPNGICLSPNSAIPWLLSLTTLTLCWTFLLGASDVRRLLQRKFFLKLAKSLGLSTTKLVLGSVFLLLLMTLATAGILTLPLRKGNAAITAAQRQGEKNPTMFGAAMGVWMMRPLPGLMVSAASVMSWNTYSGNALEVQMVEAVYALGAIYFYADVFIRSQRAIVALNPSSSSASFSAPVPATSAAAASSSTKLLVSSTAVTVTTAPNAQATVIIERISPDRTCGGTKAYTCLGSTWGNCCSAFGFCGSSEDYCARRGCQPVYGTCSSSSKYRRQMAWLEERDTAFPDGTCGAGTGATCWGSKWGECCSQFSFCGSNDTHCGKGCQPLYGRCTDAGRGSANTVLNQEVKLLKTMRSAAGIALAAIAFTFLAGLAPKALKNLEKRKRSWLVAAHGVSSILRFVAAILLWSSALTLAPQAFCLAEKSMVQVSVLWALVPLVDHCWRCLFWTR